MARKTAAQKAEEEQQRLIDEQNAAAEQVEAKKKEELPMDGEIVQTVGESLATGGPLQSGSEDTKATTIIVEPSINPGASLNLESGEKTQSDDLVLAVTLRAIPGTIIKAGALIKAPESLIEKWYAQNWADNHESALREAQKDIESKLMANPHADVGSMIIELGKNGQPAEG